MFSPLSPSGPKDLSNLLNLPETYYPLHWPFFWEDNLVTYITEKIEVWKWNSFNFWPLHWHSYLNCSPPFWWLDISSPPDPTTPNTRKPIHPPLPRFPSLLPFLLSVFNCLLSTASVWSALYAHDTSVFKKFGKHKPFSIMYLLETILFITKFLERVV